MIDLQTITEEIAKLETQKPTYGICAKLADLYIVKENLMKKQGGNYNYERGGRANYGYERGGNSGNNYAMYDNYSYDERMMDEMEMGRPSRMSMPSMR